MRLIPGLNTAYTPGFHVIIGVYTPPIYAGNIWGDPPCIQLFYRGGPLPLIQS